MPAESDRALPHGVALKAKAVLFAIRDGNRSVEAIVQVTGLPATTVLRVADLLRGLGLIGALRISSQLELMLVSQPGGDTFGSGPV